MNLCLGTVQFGMDYGVRGQKRPLIAESLAMLEYAVQNGINTFDTANAYGIAEEIIGLWLSRDSVKRRQIKLISKSMPNLLDGLPQEQYYGAMKKNLQLSLMRMGTDFLDCYLLHSARYVFEDAAIDALVQLKKDGIVGEIGASVYEVDEALHGAVHLKMDMLQLPYSIFDQRMLHGGVFDLAKEHGCVLHARSAFLQGLILTHEHEVPPFLHKARPILNDFDKICEKTGLSLVQLALGYVKQQSAISHLVFGVDNLVQLKENIELFNQDIEPDIINEVSSKFKNIDADIIVPNLWKGDL